MKYHIRNTAKDNYKSDADFGIGLATGLFFSFGGILVDGLVIVPENRREKEAVKITASDTTYAEYNPNAVQSESKRAIRGKKVSSTIGGTVVGAFLQLGIIMAALINQ
jgi:hypothetical protein